ncbi:MAG: LLM class flavin-dependent oxidoreductase [Acidimicrobiia bacterium]|nr:LLM class flavin-dependent oxidoreductase [Acidimicrobiia bacterium]
MMRRSISVIPECPVDVIVALAVRAEALGFDRCWVYDEGLATRDVYVTMAAVAAATERIGIGPGITNPYTRHPAQTAAAVASLDEMSGGRAFLGIGAGGSLTLDPIGLTRTRPLAAVREAIEVARALFAGGPVDHAGPLATLESASLHYGRPDIEIWLAGRGPKMLRLGGEVADGVMLDFIHKPSLGQYVDRVRAGGSAARICYSTAVVTDEDELEFVRPHMTYRLVDAPAPVKEAIGLTAADVDRIRSAMARGLDAAAEHVRDEWIEPFVIRGTAAGCGAEIAELGERHGIEEFLLPMFDMADQPAYLARVAAALGESGF